MLRLKFENRWLVQNRVECRRRPGLSDNDSDGAYRDPGPAVASGSPESDRDSDSVNPQSAPSRRHVMGLPSSGPGGAGRPEGTETL